MNGALVSGLYPIVRRVRRPLVIQDDDAEPPQTPPPAEGEPTVDYTKPAPAPKEKHAHPASKEQIG